MKISYYTTIVKNECFDRKKVIYIQQQRRGSLPAARYFMRKSDRCL